VVAGDLFKWSVFSADDFYSVVGTGELRFTVIIDVAMLDTSFVEEIFLIDETTATFRAPVPFKVHLGDLMKWAVYTAYNFYGGVRFRVY
jgi:hypothetical protein